MIRNKQLRTVDSMIKRGIRILVLVVVTVFSTTSCQKGKDRKDAEKIVKEWIGKEITFPQGLTCTYMGKDTTCIDLLSDNFKIVLYVDSIGCTSCRLKLHEWKTIMSESDSLFARKPEFFFIFQPKMSDKKELHIILKQHEFRHPVFIDIHNEIYKFNKFPSNPEYQCFLLDPNNKVMLVGNPSLVTEIWKLYKKVIKENQKRVITSEEDFKELGKLYRNQKRKDGANY